MITALFVIALFAFLAWMCWKFITVEWVKYLGTGLFGIVAVYKAVMLAFGMLNGI